jgi:nucleoside-diphosphate-sugar epimerase
MSSYIQDKLAAGAKLDIFVTGATGYIGTAFTKKALAAGHRVTGLSRSEAGDAKLRALGATPVRGSIATPTVLRDAAAAADAVVHLAWSHDFGRDMEAVADRDMAATDAMMAVLAGTGKPLLVTSGIGMYAARADGEPNDETATRRNDLPLIKARNRAEDNVLNRADVHGASIRLAPYCFGHGGAGFLYYAMQSALANGESLYLGDGSVRTSSLFVYDAAEVYLAAIQHAQKGEAYNVTGEWDITLKEMAEAVGQVMGVPVRSVCPEEGIQKMEPFVVAFSKADMMASNNKAREQLHWEPRGPKLLDDVVNGSYREVAAELKAQAAKGASS